MVKVTLLEDREELASSHPTPSPSPSQGSVRQCPEHFLAKVQPFIISLGSFSPHYPTQTKIKRANTSKAPCLVPAHTQQLL